jgi:nickel superoxide dismutase
MKIRITAALLLTFLLLGTSSNVFAHCQIPCGIYGDKMRIDMLMEHITTIKKSMNEIAKLSEKETPDYNQIVRWVNNKDEHADLIMDIALQYFLAQRIKPVADANDKVANHKYANQLETMHHIIVHSMKAKQTTKLEHVEKLQQLVKNFYKYYFNKEMEHHLNEHGK